VGQIAASARLLRDNHSFTARKSDVFLPGGGGRCSKRKSWTQKFFVNLPVKRDFGALGGKSSRDATWQQMSDML
jgi:hypothetical protein